MKIVCYGDSNTFGYQPDGFFGGRYDEDCRWVEFFGMMSGMQTVNFGENGREIPSGEFEIKEAADIITQNGDMDIIIIMLGTNDILGGMTAKGVCAKMKEFINALPIEKGQILLIAPPPLRQGIWVSELRMAMESAKLGDLYKALANELGTGFENAGLWGIPLLSDGVHFTEEGHRKFARSLYINSFKKR